MSKENTENKVVDFEKQLAGEREFYLRKTDTIPGSKTTLEEMREAHKQAEAEYEQKRVERALRIANENARQAVPQTSIVVPGVLVDVKVPVVVLNPNTTIELPALPSDAELKKMSSAELITLATNRGVDVKANVDSENAIIAKLKGEYTDARFASLTGKSRDVLDGFAVALGLGVDGDDLKAKFANVETLSAAIEKARK